MKYDDFDRDYFVRLTADIEGFTLSSGKLPGYLGPEEVRRYVRAAALWGELKSDPDGYPMLVMDFGDEGPYWKVYDNRKTAEGFGAMTFTVMNQPFIVRMTVVKLQNGLSVLSEGVPTKVIPRKSVQSFIDNVEKTARFHGLTDMIRPIDQWPPFPTRH